MACRGYNPGMNRMREMFDGGGGDFARGAPGISVFWGGWMWWVVSGDMVICREGEW